MDCRLRAGIARHGRRSMGQQAETGAPPPRGVARLLKAEAAADEIVQQAKAEAEQILREARQQAEAIRRAAGDTSRELEMQRVSAEVEQEKARLLAAVEGKIQELRN